QSDLITFATNPIVMAANIQRGLDSMFGAGNTVVTPQLQGNGTTANEYRISFLRDLANANIRPLGIVAVTLNPAASAVAQTVVDGLSNTVQSLTITAPTGGNVDTNSRITLSLNGETTVPLDYIPGISPTPAAVQAALSNLPSGTLNGNIKVVGPNSGP